MLATFGLERLEAALTRDSVSAADVAEILHKAGAPDPRLTDAAPRRTPELPTREPIVEPFPIGTEDTLLPTRVYVHHGSNPQFRPTRHANRV